MPGLTLQSRYNARAAHRASRICTHAGRVVESRGSLTGYAGGLVCQQFRLDLERWTM
jgi:hypothetical protein